ncbi:MAG: TIGR04438 family Trp-rich protein [Ramlibacter sp.]|nr:TIGR04438 family Trp-rich protein [Ramlibacter sp.]
MYFLLIGLGFVAMWYLEIAPVAGWAWYVVFSPFLLAVLWWAWADWSGYTKKKVIEAENARKKARIEKSQAAMGLNVKKRR